MLRKASRSIRDHPDEWNTDLLGTPVDRVDARPRVKPEREGIAHPGSLPGHRRAVDRYQEMPAHGRHIGESMRRSCAPIRLSAHIGTDQLSCNVKTQVQTLSNVELPDPQATKSGSRL